MVLNFVCERLRRIRRHKEVLLLVEIENIVSERERGREEKSGRKKRETEFFFHSKIKHCTGDATGQRWRRLRYDVDRECRN